MFGEKREEQNSFWRILQMEPQSVYHLRAVLLPLLARSPFERRLDLSESFIWFSKNNHLKSSWYQVIIHG